MIKKALFVCCLILAGLAIGKGLRSDLRDFGAYYAAAQRMLSFSNIYFGSDSYPYKYAPVTTLLFIPLLVFPQQFAFYIFTGMIFLAMASIPILVFKLVSFDVSLKISENQKVWALFFGLMASLRFLDNEFHSSQVNVISHVFLWLSLLMFLKNKEKWSPFFWGFGSCFKFHPAISSLILLNQKNYRRFLALSIVSLIIFYSQILGSH